MEKHEDEQLEIRSLDLESISTINIDDFIRDYSIDLSSAAATTTMNSTAFPSLTISNGPGGSYQNVYYPPSTPVPNTYYNFNNPGTTLNPGLYVTGDATFEGKIKWKGRDLGELLETIEKRLKILVPDPDKLEHFEALKKAYEHYKTLEALCELPTEEPDK